MKTPIEPSSARAERTRIAILSAAEELFARRGFAPTRLEDVAEAVQMTRAALFYYFRDKQSLFEAVLKYSFGPLAASLGAILAKQDSISARMELALEAWLDTIVERPALASLILRMVADSSETPVHSLFSDDNQIAGGFWALFEEGRQSGELKPLHDDTFHIASSVIGTTVFYVAALAVLLPEGGFKPLVPKQAATHKQEALRSMRLLLGITHPENKAAKPAKSSPTKATKTAKPAARNSR